MSIRGFRVPEGSNCRCQFLGPDRAGVSICNWADGVEKVGLGPVASGENGRRADVDARTLPVFGPRSSLANLRRVWAMPARKNSSFAPFGPLRRQPVQTQDAFQVRERHVDRLSLAPGRQVGVGKGEIASNSFRRGHGDGDPGGRMHRSRSYALNICRPCRRDSSLGRTTRLPELLR